MCSIMHFLSNKQNRILAYRAKNNQIRIKDSNIMFYKCYVRLIKRDNIISQNCEIIIYICKIIIFP